MEKNIDKLYNNDLKKLDINLDIKKYLKRYNEFNEDFTKKLTLVVYLTNLIDKIKEENNKRIYIHITQILEKYFKDIKDNILLKYINYYQLKLMYLNNYEKNILSIKTKNKTSEILLKIFNNLYEKNQNENKEFINENKEIQELLLDKIEEYSDIDDDEVIKKCKTKYELSKLLEIYINNIFYILNINNNKKIMNKLREIYDNSLLNKINENIIPLIMEEINIIKKQIKNKLKETKYLKTNKMLICKVHLIKLYKLSKFIFYFNKIYKKKEITKKFVFNNKLV